MIRRAAALAAVASAVLLGGCEVPGEDYAKCPRDFVAAEALLVRYNANARKVPKLWARAGVRVESEGLAWGSDAKGATPNALLTLDKSEATADAPNFVIVGRDAGVEVFRMGTDAKTGLYYLWLHLGGQGRAYYGVQALAGAPGIERVLIDPTQLVEVLGVTELPTLAPGKVPTVITRMQGLPAPAYVVSYVDAQPVTGRLKLWREISFRWKEGEPLRPFRVRLFDGKGLCRLWADLADYAPIATDAADDDPPMMPTRIRMTWPAIKGVQSASKLHLRLSEMSTTRPTRASAFSFAGNLPPGMPPPVQVDAIHGRVTPAGEKR